VGGDAAEQAIADAAGGIEEEPDLRRATIVVEDYGVGIPAAELAHIGEQFFRATNVRGLKGTGVGILSARSIVAAHGGSLEIESEEGAGTRVTIHLPLE
jgi:signal transduction histidine kinase